MSGKPVLTTKFDSLPVEYNDFLFFIDEETPDGYCSAIKKCFSKDPQEIKVMINAGVKYIKKNQNWTIISKEIIIFFRNSII